MFWGSETEFIFLLRPNTEASSCYRFLFNKRGSVFCHCSRSKTQDIMAVPFIPPRVFAVPEAHLLLDHVRYCSRHQHLHLPHRFDNAGFELILSFNRTRRIAPILIYWMLRI